MAITLLKLALTLLIAAQGSNVTPELRAQAISVANQAIVVAQAELKPQGTVMVPAESATFTANIGTVAPKKTCTITATETTIGQGSLVVLTWDVQGQKGGKILHDDGGGGVAPTVIDGVALSINWGDIGLDSYYVETSTTTKYYYHPYFKLEFPGGVSCYAKTV